MGFNDNITFPDGIAYGSRGGPGYNTSIIQIDSGAEERVSRWGTARHQYDAGYGVKSFDDLATVLDIYHAVLGAGTSFRFKDFLDCRTAAKHHYNTTAAKGDQNFGTGDASTTIFQLRKGYTSGGTTTWRTITKPVTGTILVAVAGTLKTESTDYTINYSTGLVTFNTAPTLGQALTWGGDFDVPVRFAESLDDLFDVSIDSFEEGSSPAIQLVEDLGDVTVDDQGYYGGANVIALAADTTIALGEGRVVVVTPAASGNKLILPPESNLPLGAELFHIVNLSGSYTFDIYKADGTSLSVTVAVGKFALVGLYDNAGTRTWVIAT